jgi:type I restriction enzyme S subunit
MTPDGWRAAVVGDLGEIAYGLTVSGERRGSPRRAPYLTVANLQADGFDLAEVKEIGVLDGDEARYALECGDVLLVEGNANAGRLGNAALWDGQLPFAMHQNHLIRVRPHKGRVVPEWLVRVLNSGHVRGQIAEVAKTSSGLHTINSGVVRALIVAVPPRPEQRKIAAILSSVDDAIEATQAVIDQLGVVKKAMMAELLTRGLPGRHTRFKRTDVGEVPHSWTTASYAELADSVSAAIQSGPFGSELKHAEFTPEGHLVIGIDNVLDARFSIGSNHRISRAKFCELQRFEARPLDLLITVMATVGRCCVVPANIEPAIITKHVYRLTVNRKRANPYFLMYCLYGVQRLANEVRGSAQGLTRPGLNKSLLCPLRFPLPPLDEQNEIVAALDAMDSRVGREQDVLSGLRPLKSALMSVLLTGEMRVKPDEDAA